MERLLVGGGGFMNDSARLQAIRDDLAAIAPGHWTLGADGDGMLVEGRAEMGELVLLARFSAQASADEARFMADAVENVRFLVGLVDRAIKAAKRGSPNGAHGERACGPASARAGETSPGARSGARPTGGEREVKDFAAEAAMKCAEPAFKAFMEERHGLERPLTDERVAQRLRSLLGIDSRARLNDDAAAADRWKALRADFQAWRKVGADTR